MLNINNDSWVTLEEAEEMISELFISSNTYLKAWKTLSDEDKEILLRQSAFSITDAFKFIGRKSKRAQRLAFPRVLCSLPIGEYYLPIVNPLYDTSVIKSYSLDDGLEDAKRAQVVNAVYGATMADLTADAHKNFSTGLKSKSIGPVSESYDTVNPYLEGSLVGIYTKQVESILSSWLTSSRFSF